MDDSPRPVPLKRPFYVPAVTEWADHQAFTLALEEVADHRNLDCSEYDDCLGLAVVQGWKGFSCKRCPRHSGWRLEEGDPLELRSVVKRAPLELL